MRGKSVMSESESALERTKKVVLMTGQNKTRPQAPDGFGITSACIRQGNAKNCKIDRAEVVRRELRGRSAGVEIDPFPGRFDEEGERLAADPVARPARWTGALARTGKGNTDWKNAIVRRGQNANFPRTDLPNVCGRDGAAASGRCAGRCRQLDRCPGSKQARTGHLHNRWDVEQMIDVTVGVQNQFSVGEKISGVFDFRDIRRDRPAKKKRAQPDPGKIRIHQQGVLTGFESITARPEISHADA